jgi:hypothetical protein
MASWFMIHGGTEMKLNLDLCLIGHGRFELDGGGL